MSKNPGVWRGRAFWCGAYDVDKREVVEVHTYEECETVDFNSYWVFTKIVNVIEAEDKFRKREWIFFRIDDGNVETEEDVPADIRVAIRSQIRITEGVGVWKGVPYTRHCSCGKSERVYGYVCPKCGRVWFDNPYEMHYCPSCGKPMTYGEDVKPVPADPDAPVKSVSEEAIVRNAAQYLQDVIDDYNSWQMSDADYVPIPDDTWADVVYRVLLRGSGHTYKTSAFRKAKALGFDPNERAYPEREEEE